MAYRGRRDFGGGFTRAKRLRARGCDKEQGEQASKKASSSCSTAMGDVGKAGGVGKGGALRECTEASTAEQFNIAALASLAWLQQRPGFQARRLLQD